MFQKVGQLMFYISETSLDDSNTKHVMKHVLLHVYIKNMKHVLIQIMSY